MIYKITSSILLILLCWGTISAQESDSTIFAKGRILSSLYGNISNQNADVSSGGSIKTTGYRIGTKSGVFIKDRLAIGLNFELSRTDFDKNDFKLDSENFLIGPWSRLYFARNGSVSLYAEITPHYTAIYNENIVYDSDNSIISNEDVYGNGFGITPGLGFIYIINNSVGFGMSLSYTASRIYLQREDDILFSTSKDTYDISELQFSFNFHVYLDQFFF
ncbi:outer membrane beta-barrel protein [Saccharicrinis aurantiacus]|uniref:outer membrane beta-barrel protein n=1 Tax=Saccharicrinis aurantiacus TaxID=1849719 RepID=UPI0008390D8F|nr:outer membrane beta-barrel protein [Saccharicrinis aurantiacus]